PDFDEACNEFAPLLESEATNSLEQILLWDQIPRNIYRQSAKAYAFDRQAQQLALSLIDTDFEQKLSLPERIFLYMPLQHAEDLELQALSVAKFKKLHALAPSEIQTWTRLGVVKALDHQRTIEEHGHFPTR